MRYKRYLNWPLILLLHSNGFLCTNIMLDIPIVSLLESSSAYIETEGYSGYDYFILMAVVWVAIEIGASVDAAEVKVKFSPYKPGVAQRVGRVIALDFHDCGTRRGWVVSSTTRPHFTPGKDPVPILQEAGWAPGPV